MIPFGPYRLQSQIGKGGVGKVWAAEVGPRRTPVAFKVLNPKEAPELRRAFLNEVRAFASLDHPNIVAIYDFGYGDPDTEEQTQGIVPDHSAWLVMERVHGRSLYGYRTRLSWRQFRKVLLDVLDALAHAHSRQVIHRDIKPSNVLVTPDGASTKLTDFGLSACMAHEPQSLRHMRRATGTPSYMSPEQITGQWHRQGPWTDLYGLGCLVYTMAHGKPMFRNVEPNLAMRRHLVGDVPPFEPKMELPPKFADWLAALLRPNPADRPRTAADASFLLRLVDDTGDRLPPPRPAPMPRKWRRRNPSPPFHFGQSSPALFGLRNFRVVGRDDLQESLWNELAKARMSQRCRVVLLRGPSGIGKTRVLQWLSERSIETAAARTFWLGLAEGEARKAVARMLQRAWNTDDVSPERMPRQIRERAAPVSLPGPLLDGLSALLGRPDDASLDAVSLFAQLMAQLSAERPVLICLDDVDRSPVVGDLVAALAAQSDAGPVLVVATASQEGLTQSPDVERRWRELAGHTWTLPPLDPKAGFTLLNEGMDLDPRLAGRVARQVEGNPLLAVELVGAWLREGTLEPGPHGLALRAGAELSPPADLKALWEDRLAEATATLAPSEVESLEVAAALGVEVDAREWTRAGALLGLTPSWDGLEVLVSAGLARIERGPDETRRFSFSHELVRLALLEGARDRWQSLHNACAAVLSPDSLRAAHHWIEAGRPERVLEPLRTALHVAADRGLDNEAEQAAELLERAMAEAGIDEDAPEWLLHWVNRSKLAERRGALDDALAFAQRAMVAAEEGTRGEMSALRQLGRLQRRAGQFELATESLTSVIAWAEAHDEIRLEANARRDLAFLNIRAGNFDFAWKQLERAEQCFELADSPLGLAGVVSMKGLIKKQQGHLDEAIDLVRLSADIGHTSLKFQAICKNNLADLERLRGKYDAAWKLLEEASELNRRTGDTTDWINLLNRGLVLLARGRALDAREEIERALRRRADHLGLQVCHAGLLVATARLHDWTGFADQLDRIEDLGRQCTRVDIDLALFTEEAGGLALKKKKVHLAARALELASRQWEGLGRSAEKARADKLRQHTGV